MSNKDYREEARKLFGDNLVTEEHKKMIQRGIKSGRLTVVSHDDLSRPYHPVSAGGETDPDNLWTLCWICNRKKSNNIL